MASNVDKVRAAEENWNRRDFNACVKDLTDNCTFVDHARGITLHGKQEYLNYIREWAQVFTDGKITNPQYIDGGNVVVCEFTAEGTNDGRFAGFPPTNRRIEFGYCEIWHFDNNGRMTSGGGYYDQLSIMQKLGHLQERKAA